MTEEQFRLEVLHRLDLMINGFRDALGYLHCIDTKLHALAVPTPDHKDDRPVMAVRVATGYKEDKSRILVPHDYVPPGGEPPAGGKKP